jgi:hypothetical protein
VTTYLDGTYTRLERTKYQDSIAVSLYQLTP